MDCELKGGKIIGCDVCRGVVVVVVVGEWDSQGSRGGPPTGREEILERKRATKCDWVGMCVCTHCAMWEEAFGLGLDSKFGLIRGPFGRLMRSPQKDERERERESTKEEQLEEERHTYTHKCLKKSGKN